MTRPLLDRFAVQSSESLCLVLVHIGQRHSSRLLQIKRQLRPQTTIAGLEASTQAAGTAFVGDVGQISRPSPLMSDI